VPTPHGWICTKYVVAVYLADIIAFVNFYSNWLKGFYFMVVKILPLSTDLRYRGITIDEGVSYHTAVIQSFIAALDMWYVAFVYRSISCIFQEQQHETDREALEQERKRRRELERRLAEEMAKHNEIMEQTIKLREKQKVQASKTPNMMFAH